MKEIKNTKKQPLVSVIIPVYNYGMYLSAAIDSILRQTYSAFELIIVDDASTDKSFEIIDGYKNMYPDKIQVIHLKKNLNSGGDRCANEGIKKARGEYIARMDADDIALPTRLEKQVDFLEKNPDVFLVGSNAYVIDGDGQFIGEKLQPQVNEEILRTYSTFHPIIHPSSMYRATLNKKEEFEYKIKYKSNNDYYTFFNLICNGYIFANLSEKLIYYRIHEKSDTFRHVKRTFFTILRIRIRMIIKNRYPMTLKSGFFNLAQIILVILLSEKTIKNLYLLTRGITKKASPQILSLKNSALSHEFHQ